MPGNLLILDANDYDVYLFRMLASLQYFVIINLIFRYKHPTS